MSVRTMNRMLASWSVPGLLVYPCACFTSFTVQVVLYFKNNTSCHMIANELWLLIGQNKNKRVYILFAVYGRSLQCQVYSLMNGCYLIHERWKEIKHFLLTCCVCVCVHVIRWAAWVFLFFSFPLPLILSKVLSNKLNHLLADGCFNTHLAFSRNWATDSREP